MSGPRVSAARPQTPLDMLKEGWRSASPSQLQEISQRIRNAGLTPNMAELGLAPCGEMKVESQKKQERSSNSEPDSDEHVLDIPTSAEKKTKAEKCADSDHRCAINSLSATLAYIRDSHHMADDNTPFTKEGQIRVLKRQDAMKNAVSPVSNAGSPHITPAVNEERSEAGVAVPPGAKPLLPGSYWYGKNFQSKTATIELPSKSPEDVRRVLASLTNPRNKQRPADSSVEREDVDIDTPQASIDASESYSADTLIDDLPEVSNDERNSGKTVNKFKPAAQVRCPKMDSERIIPGKTTKHDMDHKLGNCVAEDCMCYEVVFRQDQPIETSSLKSDSSFMESPEISPKRSRLPVQKLSTSSMSDESGNSSIHRRRSRIAANFGQTVE